MRLTAFLFFSLLTSISVFSQTSNTSRSVNHPNVYALVVGISKYLQKDIPELQFADRDARVFADYLKSKAGGSVPAENIQLLINEEATTSAVYDAIYWLKKSCTKDDIVFIYFSGHGDLENITIFNNGFLICYDSPPNNYVKLALSVDYLNQIANTLSAQINANVVLITDACHAGKLAGSKLNGTFLVADQLRATKDREIRLTACATDQLSNENEAWGGGRGVFSYYLTSGLKGLADNNKDGFITKEEIKKYLDSSFAKDAVLKRENIIQNPVLTGKGDFVLAKVDETEEKKAANEMASFTAAQTMNQPILKMSAGEDVPANPREYFFNLLKKKSIENLTDSLKLNEIPKEEIPFALMRNIIEDVKADAGKNVEGNSKLTSLLQLEKTLKENKDALKRFNGKLATAFDEKGQQVIDQYLAGDAAELERRRYYNIQNNGYDVYPKMFEVAMKLTQPDNYLYNVLEVKLHYFSGVAARLKIPTVEDPKPLIEKALAEEKKALTLEEHAAYIYNELAILNMYKKNLAVAEEYFLKASEIAPQWSIPWSNLIGIYATTGRYDKGIDAAAKTKERQPDNQNLFLNSGLLYERKGNLLMAEELYRKSIDINSRHYFPFERLANVYLNTTQYTNADSFFYEAEIRKMGYHFNDLITPIPFSEVLAPYLEPPLCMFDTRDIKPSDVIGNFVWGLYYLKNSDSVHAEEKFKLVIALDKSNPLAFHYLGKILYGQKRWKEGDIIFNLAIKYYLDTTAFKRYCTLMKRTLPSSPSMECIFTNFVNSYYEKADDYYFLATLYDKWNHYTEAEEQYKNIIRMDPNYIDGYYKLWNMLERIGRYKNAEDIIRNYIFYNPELGNSELYGFYKRMCERFPESGAWNYSMGIFLYQTSAENPGLFSWDKKYFPPDKHEEVYVQDNVYHSHARATFILPGTQEVMNIAEPVEWPRTEGIKYLQKALALLQSDEDAMGDINQKIGDLYVWQGLPGRANTYYKASIDLKPDDAATRLKLVDTYAAVYLLQDALAQLDSLNIRKEINFPKQLLLAKYDIHSGRFAEAQQLLQEAKKIHPYVIPEIIDLNGRLQLLSQHPKEALGFYTQLYNENKNNFLVMYSIARLYAKLGNDAEAFKWLQLSLQKGFNYSYVLRFDPYTESLRKSAKWNSLLKGVTMKSYPPPPKSIL